jgi:hypothetical protein
VLEEGYQLPSAVPRQVITHALHAVCRCDDRAGRAEWELNSVSRRREWFDTIPRRGRRLTFHLFLRVLRRFCGVSARFTVPVDGCRVVPVAA